MRLGDFKLIEWYEDMNVELFNLKDDIGEHHDLAKENPAKAAELLKLLRDWRKRVTCKCQHRIRNTFPRPIKPTARKKVYGTTKPATMKLLSSNLFSATIAVTAAGSREASYVNSSKVLLLQIGAN